MATENPCTEKARSNFDECDLERALSREERKAKREKRFSILLAFAKGALVFVATTGAVGVLTLMHSNYTNCRAALADDQKQFSMISGEFSGRIGGVSGIVLVPSTGKDHPVKDGTISRLINAFDPNDLYEYREFKGISLSELAERGRSLILRWNPEVRSANLANIGPLSEYLGPGGIFSQKFSTIPGTTTVLVPIPDANVLEAGLRAIGNDTNRDEVNILLKEVKSWAWRGLTSKMLPLSKIFPENACLSWRRLALGAPSEYPPFQHN